ncbi:MAG: hypothetical protein F9K24_22705 [Leptonema illini]|uniref:Uncharacterized protein n=1 Tax=Leptonema illini TaxID=183 RepID=A0A833LUS0_9LEPT|nr:MAG: hypothetical protein F9K24_22705 [Leptonema illini]
MQESVISQVRRCRAGFETGEQPVVNFGEERATNLPVTGRFHQGLQWPLAPGERMVGDSGQRMDFDLHEGAAAGSEPSDHVMKTGKAKNASPDRDD